VRLVELAGARLGIDGDANAPICLGHAQGEVKYETQHGFSDALSLDRFIDGEPREPKDGHRVLRQAHELEQDESTPSSACLQCPG
jgi:hypothetical protein